MAKTGSTTLKLTKFTKSTLNSLISYLVILIIKAYQWLISPILGQRCRFYPSCSHYAIAAVQNHGIIRGVFLTLKRLLKCHPWHAGGVDPVPDKPNKPKKSD